MKKLIKNNYFICLLFILGYLLIPSLIASLVYRVNSNKMLCTLVGDIVFAVIIYLTYRKEINTKFKEYFNNGENIKITFKYWLKGLIGMGIANLIINLFIFDGGIAANEEINRMYLIEYPIVSFFVVVITGPFIEEYIFRYVIRVFAKDSKLFPLVSGLIFGLLHALTEIETPLQLLYIIPYGMLGYAFAAAYQKTDNMFTNIFAHLVHNLMCFCLIVNYL